MNVQNLCIPSKEEDQCTGSDGVKYDKYQKWKEDCNTCTCLRGGRRYCTDNVCEISKSLSLKLYR